ncbi:GntR family transcriptional regulator [soil metagenome]
MNPLTTPTSSAPARVALAKGTSLHRQLFLVLRDQIAQGAFAPGGVLPKEEALCERFGVSRITVRRALADLAALGLVERRHGLGTFVRPDLPMARAVPSLSLIDSLKKAALETQVKVLEVAHDAPPRDIATLLHLAPGVQAVHAIRLRSIRETPVMLTDAWVPTDLGKKVSASALRKNALYELLLAQGVEFGRVVQEITAVAADPARAQVLQTEVGAPLLKLVRVMHDTAARPVQHLTAYMSPEHSRILMDIPGPTVNTLSAGQIVHDVR